MYVISQCSGLNVLYVNVFLCVQIPTIVLSWCVKISMSLMDRM